MRMTLPGQSDTSLSLTSPQPSLWRWGTWSGRLAAIALTTGCLVGVVQTPSTAQVVPQNPEIKVGIKQRFGSDPADTLTLQPVSGDRLSVSFKAANGQVQTLTTTGDVKIDVVMEPLPEPKVTERVVLSTHRSFESAEDSANQWRKKGIEVEVAQPRQWQVWAKRDTYSSPLLRRLLLNNVQAQGSRTAFLDAQAQWQIPKAAVTINNFRYIRDEIDIQAGNNRIYVNESSAQSDRQLFAGTLRIQPNAYGTYTLVNTVPIESYLRGVVPHEIGLRAPTTAIQAQAILARTYALRNLRRFAIDNYELCADTQCQVYKGLSGAAEVTDRAIAATRGQVLTYQNELIDALYSSTTGGVTARFSDVWNGPDRPYLQSRVDSVENVWDLSLYPLSDERNFQAFINLKEGFNEAGWDTFRWQETGTLTEIASDLKKFLDSQKHPMANLTEVKRLEVIERSPAGRVQKLAVETDRGTLVLEKDEILRALYAPNSTLFYLQPIYDERPAPAVTPQPPTSPATSTTNPNPDGAIAEGVTPDTGSESSSTTGAPPTPAAPIRVLKGYTFIGGGLGHAVGMSQTGAYHLGKLGWPAARLLAFYYPGTQLQPLTDRIIRWRDPAEQ